MLINKEIVKELAKRECLRLAFLLTNEKELARFYRFIVEQSLSEDDFDDDITIDYESLSELYKLNPSIFHELKEEMLEKAGPIDRLIYELKDYDEVSMLSRRYYSQLYSGKARRADTVDGSVDGTVILGNKAIEENTLRLLNDPEVEVIFEGQVTYDDKYLARWDIMIKKGKELELIELKATKNVLTSGGSLKEDYLMDILFQYYVYKNVLPQSGFIVKNVSFLTLNPDFFLHNESEPYPLKDQYLPLYFAPLTNKVRERKRECSLMSYLESNMDRMGKILSLIDESLAKGEIDDSDMRYYCKKCLFFEECLRRCKYPVTDNVFTLTGYNRAGGNYRFNRHLVNDIKIRHLSEIDDDLCEEHLPLFRDDSYNVANLQIKAAKKRLEVFIDRRRIKELLGKEYSVWPLVFFDFETFSYPIPIINFQKSFEQICTQYSMHVVRKDYDIFSHNYDEGSGGNITHYEFIGSPKDDLANNPEMRLIETLISQMQKEKINHQNGEFTLVTYNKVFEKGRFKNLAEKYPVYKNFLLMCSERIVDLMDFMVKGYLYLPEFHGRSTLKVIAPVLKSHPSVKEYYSSLKFDLDRTLDYQSEDNVFHNGSEALDAYQTLLRGCLTDNVSDRLHDDIINGLLYYCKKDSWSTVVIFDIISKIADDVIRL